MVGAVKGRKGFAIKEGLVYNRSIGRFGPW